MMTSQKIARTSAESDEITALLSRESRLAENARHALLELHDCVDAQPETLGGVAVLRGTRFPISQLLAEIADGRDTNDIAGAFDLDAEIIGRFLHGLALCL